MADSAAPHQRDNLDAIAGFERAGGMLASRDQIPVPFDGHESRLHLEPDQEPGDGRARRDLVRLSIDDQLEHDCDSVFSLSLSSWSFTWSASHLRLSQRVPAVGLAVFARKTLILAQFARFGERSAWKRLDRLGGTLRVL